MGKVCDFFYQHNTFNLREILPLSHPFPQPHRQNQASLFFLFFLSPSPSSHGPTPILIAIDTIHSVYTKKFNYQLLR